MNGNIIYLRKILCYRKTVKIMLRFPFGNSYVRDLYGYVWRCWMFPKIDER